MDSIGVRFHHHHYCCCYSTYLSHQIAQFFLPLLVCVILLKECMCPTCILLQVVQWSFKWCFEMFVKYHPNFFFISGSPSLFKYFKMSESADLVQTYSSKLPLPNDSTPYPFTYRVDTTSFDLEMNRVYTVSWTGTDGPLKSTIRIEKFYVCISRH